MRCSEVLEALRTMQGGGAPSDAALAELEALGLVARATIPAGAEGVATLRDALKAVQAGRAEARASLATAPDAEAAALRERVTALEREERELRSAILELAELPAVARSLPQLTFVGRDLMGELETRIGRVGDVELTQFQASFGQFRDRLATTARRASALLAVLSPKRGNLDEIHLRSAVLSLAVEGADTPTEALAARFSSALDALGPTITDAEGRVQVAEAYAVSPGTDLRGLAEFYRDLHRTVLEPGDAAAVAAIAWGEGPDRRYAVANRGIELARSVGMVELAPGVLFTDADRPDRVDRFPGLRDALSRLEPDASAATWAGVLLALAPVEPLDALRRFQEVRAWLSRFGSDGLSAPAAMLTLLDAEAPELLDDLRLASNAVREQKLSLSAMENLGLGAKLLVQVALGRDGPPLLGAVDVRPPLSAPAVSLGAASPAIALPMTRFPRTFTQAVSSYHCATIHRRVVVHDWSHPVHTHRVYG